MAFGHSEAEALQPNGRKSLLLYISLPVLTIVVSASLIRSNRFLMQPDNFPFPFVLVIMHCIFCSLFALALRCVQPNLFPALTDPDKKVELSLRYYTTAILPIALCFAISLVLSNMAYKYSSVAFLQMIKEGNIITIYVMAIFCGIESFSVTQALILGIMVAATWSCVEGELNFSLLGFVVQATSCFCEAAKTIFQALVLTGDGRKLDPLSTVLVVMPMCGLLLISVLLFNNLVVDVGFVPQPTLEKIYQWRYVLGFNILNAFCLNVVIAVFLKYLSPVSYILTGNIKDICVVCMSAFMIHEAISLTQVMGFTMQVLCVFAWTAYKNQQSLKKALEAAEEPMKTN